MRAVVSKKIDKAIRKHARHDLEYLYRIICAAGVFKRVVFALRIVFKIQRKR